MKGWLTAISFGLAMAAAIYLLVGPIYSGVSSGSDGVRTVHATLIQVNGMWALIPVSFPVVIALLPLVFRRQAVWVVATILIGGFTLVGSFTIGLFYLPAAVMMLLAACAAPSQGT